MNNKTKNSIRIFGLVTFTIAVMLFSSCNSSTANDEKQKADEAKENLDDAKAELEEAQKDYDKQYEAFKEEMNNQIIKNKEAIATLRANTSTKSKTVKAELDKKLAELEQQNELLNERMINYKKEDMSKWDSFKVEFKRDMDNLGQSLTDLTKDNVK